MDQVKAEYEASWNCPRCGAIDNDTNKGEKHNGDTIDVTCYAPDCKHDYEVFL